MTDAYPDFSLIIRRLRQGFPVPDGYLAFALIIRRHGNETPDLHVG